MPFDVFLSHASEDKEAVVRPLAAALEARGLSVWVDEMQVMIGDSLRAKIDEGLAQSRFGAVILSPSFFAKNWPRWELDGLAAREAAEGRVVVLPVWHRVGPTEVAGFSPLLAGKLAANTADGVDRVADEIAARFTDAPTSPAPAPSATASTPAAASTASDVLSWRASDEAWERLASDALRSHDDIALRLAIEEAIRDAATLLDQCRVDELELLLDRLTCLGALFLRLELMDWFDRVLRALVEVYTRGFDARGYTASRPCIPSSMLWLGIIARVQGLGALAVRRGNWVAVRSLALQTPDGAHFRDGLYTNWIRHAHVEAARGGHLQMQLSSGQTAKTSLLNIALEEVRRLACLTADVGNEDEDRLRMSLGGFDALAALAVLNYAPGDRDFSYYPSYGDYEPDRYEHVFRTVIADDGARGVIFPESDAKLAGALRLLEQWVVQEGARLGGGYRIMDPQVREFIAQNSPEV